ncbi:hypothetical protein JOL79_09245 [Microbispora sp. RL4-1S]|uniref:Tat pathway signal sequence domain protein n=1 Tax=Microbispora oryzae TaxID=2806554 RepID=A0A941AHE2_9ACTN|nr:hypothetical protein [Microbispora oryzae]MBP2703991.1 hypothetical protein [Microbispora oryzae]
MPRDRRLRAAAALAALSVVVAACGGTRTPGSGPDGGGASGPGGPGIATARDAGGVAGAPSGTPPAETPAAETPGTGTPPVGGTGSPAPRPPSGPYLVAGRYQPLWPFSDQAEADAWRATYQTGGHQPWHLDARQTALSFTQGFLGFGRIDRIVRSSVSGSHARVAVGFRPEESGRLATAAVIHLVRYGRGEDAPWEVVGTDDTTFTLTTPAYGATVASPAKAGGRITGVDESIRVQVRQPWSDRPLGDACCVPAGGEGHPWSSKVAFRARPGWTATVVAMTGGHVAEVERFAVTGVRVATG